MRLPQKHYFAILNKFKFNSDACALAYPYENELSNDIVCHCLLAISTDGRYNVFSGIL